MNKVILMGRLTRNPDVRYSQGEKATRTQTLSTVLHSEDRASLRRSI